MKLLLNDYKRNKWLHIFVLVQFAVIISMLNLSVSKIVYYIKDLTYITDYEERTYLYEGIMDTTSGGKETIDRVENLKGVQDVGYEITDTVTCDSIMASDYTYELYMEYLSPFATSIEHKVDQGSWFDGGEKEIVLCGEGFDGANVGDTVSVTNSSGTPVKCKIIGIIDEPGRTLSYDTLVSNDNDLSCFLYKEQGTIFTNDISLLKGIEPEQYQYSFYNLLVRLTPDCDTEQLERCGHLVSIDKLVKGMENTATDYIANQAATNGLWIFVLIIGSVAITYLMTYKTMSSSAVYYLLGMSRRRIVGNMVLSNCFTYILSGIVTYFAYPIVREDLMFTGKWDIANYIATAILVGITIVITIITSCLVYTKTPTEMLKVAQTKGN